MATKTRPFSIYLLKPGFDATNALTADHGLEAAEDATNLPPGATAYVLDTVPKEPWWRGYFGIQRPLSQTFKGALVFVPVGERTFALAFGPVFHHLSDVAYEYDFGLRVTLNSLDPGELRSADVLEPGAARRRRTQVPASTELTYLDFDGNSDIIKSLTGKVKPELKNLFKAATGASSLKISLKLTPDEFVELCKKLLALYDSDEYKEVFPNIDNIAPVRDPDEIRDLDAALLDQIAVREDLALGIPDIIDYRDNSCCVFSGEGHSSDIHPDINLDAFFEFLDRFGLAVNSIEDLKNLRVILTDADGNPGGSYNIYRSLICDIQRPSEGLVYHLSEGNWYKVNESYIQRITSYLDSKCELSDLCPYDHDQTVNGKDVYSEGAYNAALPTWDQALICLDQTDIAPSGHTQIEPCDVYKVIDDPTAPGGVRAFMYHIKISTRSSSLSHLFSQGVNALELVILDEDSRGKLRGLIQERLGGNDEDKYLRPLDDQQFSVVYGIVTRKPPEGRSDNLPLFSKISLNRTMQQLDLMRVPGSLRFIPDESPEKGSHLKYVSVAVEVRQDGAGKHVVEALPGQPVPEGVPITRCPREVSQSPLGSRFTISVRIQPDGSLTSFHKWPFAQLP